MIIELRRGNFSLSDPFAYSSSRTEVLSSIQGPTIRLNGNQT